MGLPWFYFRLWRINKSPSLELLKAEAEVSLSKGAKHAVLRHVCPWQSVSVLLKESPATGNFNNLQSFGVRGRAPWRMLKCLKCFLCCNVFRCKDVWNVYIPVNFLIFLFFHGKSIEKIYIFTQIAWLTQKAYIKFYMECSGVYIHWWRNDRMTRLFISSSVF